MRVWALVLALFFAAAGTGAAAGDCLRQGEFALALAKKLRLDVTAEAGAAAGLSGLGITPDAGWEPEVYLDAGAFNEVDRAVIVAFAEGRLARGYPSAARAVLSSVTMPGDCSEIYHGTAPAPAAAPLTAGGIDSPSPEKVAPQQQPQTAALPVPETGSIPIYDEPRPGIDEPGPGEKPRPYSPSEPWDGPTRPGPGSR